jgi:NADH-quinone oxidoreductase subunit C
MAYPMVENERLETVRIRAQFGDAVLKVKEYRGETFVCLQRDRIVDVVQFLKEDPELAYDYFVECLGADYSRWEHERDLPERFEVIYNLYSTKHSSRLFLKIGVDDGQSIPTLKHVFLGAEYPEKETGDMFGIHFAGNELEVGERFLLPDDWAGYPLRKEYPLGGEDVLFDRGDRGPAVEDVSMPHAGESFEGKTGSEDVSGR